MILAVLLLTASGFLTLANQQHAANNEGRAQKLSDMYGLLQKEVRLNDCRYRTNTRHNCRIARADASNGFGHKIRGDDRADDRHQCAIDVHHGRLIPQAAPRESKIMHQYRYSSERHGVTIELGGSYGGNELPATNNVDGIRNGAPKDECTTDDKSRS